MNKIVTNWRRIWGTKDLKVGEKYLVPKGGFGQFEYKFTRRERKREGRRL